MKKYLTIALLAVAALAAPTLSHAQSGYASPMQFRVLTKEQKQTSTKNEINADILQTIATLEQRFDTASSRVSNNAYHLTGDEVLAGLGDADAAKAAQAGALLLSTIIKANAIGGNDVTKAWLAQDWVQAWIAKYKLDPATGDPLPAQ